MYSSRSTVVKYSAQNLAVCTGREPLGGGGRKWRENEDYYATMLFE